jgi:chorismate mutase
VAAGQGLNEEMGMPIDHVKNLEQARKSIVEVRRSTVQRLAKRGSNPDDVGDFTAIQQAIDAIDRALADEMKPPAESPAG